ncbi:uncharacterized protein LOC127717660 [Mytilus californianus]|uniref:uncharacterized protein LOC127717660 n=1 Tax=Mytilus californianus TaxID=6549 RepID=UPI002245DE4A|nr:uncharacterized protein LOC127717660 [Mytilus californianus]
MEIMSTYNSKCESLKFYTYLCQNIGSDEVVKIRRLAFTILDLGQSFGHKTITSGSKGEGLDLKGSDLDIMALCPFFKVYESEKEVVLDGLTIPLVMVTDETHPCFTQLCRLNHHGVYNLWDLCFKEIPLWQKHPLGYMLSSEQYQLLIMSLAGLKLAELKLPSLAKTHGPCLTSFDDQLDKVVCLKCDQWLFQTQPWIRRPRTAWPSPEIISKIISCGVLFVPIGCKGSANENLEWRISFSVAEKFLIYSFNHTQFLCYGLLKILLKEIVEKHEDLKGLLCSYFLKTLMFWMSEETDPNLWRPDNMIPCFMACLQRLLYCVRYSILLHFFISDNNFFYSRFNAMNKKKLETILSNLYERGINCFASSDTLKDYQSQYYKVTHLLTRLNFKTFELFVDLSNLKKIHILYHCLHHSRTGSCQSLFALYLSKSCWFVPHASNYLYTCYNSENKHQYSKYKYDLSHLLIGVHSDAVTGWLTLASYFYVKKNYVASLRLINYALQKYTDEKIFTGSGFTKYELTFIQKHVLNLMKTEKLYSVLRSLRIETLTFGPKSSIIPQELQLDVTKSRTCYSSLPFAYFLGFLCNYHLHDITSYRRYLQQLILTKTKDSIHVNLYRVNTAIMCGVAHQLIGEAYFAKGLFQEAARQDKYNFTSAATRLSRLT